MWLYSTETTFSFTQELPGIYFAILCLDARLHYQHCLLLLPITVMFTFQQYLQCYHCGELSPVLETVSLTETLILRIWYISDLQIKRQSYYQPTIHLALGSNMGKKQTPSTFPCFKGMLFTRRICFFNISTTKTQLISKLE